MLKNSPPPGTKVIFLRKLRTARAFDIATLIRPLGTFFEDRRDDQFEVESRGERIIVEDRRTSGH